MPTYQYACTNPDCGHRFELVQSFTDPSVSTCPECGEPVRKVFSAVGVVFKGSGFYRTDSREAAKQGAAASAAKSAAKSGDSTKESAGSAASSDSSSAGSSAKGSSSDSPSSKVAAAS